MTRIICFFSLLLGFIAPAEAQRSAASTDTVKIELDKDNGKTCLSNKQKGTIVRIELAGALGGTGYVWKNLTGSSLAISYISTEALVADPGLMGSSTKNVYLYRVTGKKGCIRLNFKLQRPWESDDKIIKTFNHTISVYKAKP